MQALKKITLNKALEQKADLLNAAGDPARIRILLTLFNNDKACVSDIAESIDMSIACTSHHLHILKRSGLLDTERMGTNICYSLKNDQNISLLKKLIQ